ncbi:2CS histidine protein kinase [Bifidobacterium avesanii]|uniref:2CS histidine protein kinase n=1 Tax=Bifidobacterium avesanii TaxID=1798157 RepID=A0A7K3TKH7_9BIFI|nr:2CS histidine protein kinase [Bifidobacterium avesanii]KAB8288897.1 2CS histidine protein kinase [Bifidobacterium avesanii]NEG79174.1 2CS histidine protein kinase [Bifidobacterium avesanii]
MRRAAERRGSAWARRLRSADEEAGNAWLFMAYTLTALACATETVAKLGVAGGLSFADALCAFAFVGLLSFAAFRPVSGAAAALVWWMALCVAPVGLPSGMMLGALLAVGVLGYAHRGVGAIAAAAAVLVWACSRGGLDVGALLFGQGGSSTSAYDTATPSEPPEPSQPLEPSPEPSPQPGGHTILGAVTLNGVVPVLALFAGFLIGGVAARWGHERDRLESGLRLRRQRERAARDIHDYVSNDLAYVILRLDRDIADGRTVGADELRGLRAAAAKALGHTHEVIALIERGDGDEAADGDERMPGNRPAGMGEALRRQCEPWESRLRTLGFEGQTIIVEQPGAEIGGETRELLDGLLGELYANIGRHADPAGGYVLTVRLSPSGVDVALADTASARSPDALSSGTGLARYRTRIERMGGSMRVNGGEPNGGTGGEWSLAVTIPTA